MEFFYLALFLALVLVAITLQSQQTGACLPEGEAAAKSLPAFKRFKNNYLLVYSLMMGKGLRRGLGSGAGCGGGARGKGNQLPRRAALPCPPPACGCTRPSRRGKQGSSSTRGGCRTN